MIVNSFPESQPEIQQSQSAGEAANETARNDLSEVGLAQEQGIVSPLRCPGQYQKQNPERRAQRHDQQRPNSHQPYRTLAIFRFRADRCARDVIASFATVVLVRSG